MIRKIFSLSLLVVLLVLISIHARSAQAQTTSLKVQYKVADPSAPNDNQIKPHFQIINGSSSAVAANTLKIRYYFTKEAGASTFTGYCDYAVIGCANVSISFSAVSPVTSGADTYAEVSFTGGSIAAGGSSGEIQTRFNKTDWSNFAEAGDYSYDATKTAFADWNRVVLLQNGVVVWGTAPGGTVPTNTPGGVTGTKTPTRTATRTRTVTRTSTVTRTPTTPVGGLPDLTITAIVNAPSTLPCGSGFNPGTNVTVNNLGTADTGAFVISANTLQQTISGLNAGQSITLRFNINGGTITAKADATNMIAESNETNNSMTKTLPVSDPIPCASATPTKSNTPGTPTITPTFMAGDLGCKTITGTVRNLQGNPLGGVVMFFTLGYSPGGTCAGGVISALTNDNGTFTLGPIFLHDTGQITVTADPNALNERYLGQFIVRNGLQTFSNPTFNFTLLRPTDPTLTPTPNITPTLRMIGT